MRTHSAQVIKELLKIKTLEDFATDRIRSHFDCDIEIRIVSHEEYIQLDTALIPESAEFITYVSKSGEVIVYTSDELLGTMMYASEEHFSLSLERSLYSVKKHISDNDRDMILNYFKK